MPDNKELIKNGLAKAAANLVDTGLRNNRLIHTDIYSTRTKSIKIVNGNNGKILEHFFVEKAAIVIESKEAKNGSKLSLKVNLDIDVTERKIKKLYYDAIDHENEKGSNVLYLALGFLKWFESAESTEERFAPLVLLPVQILWDRTKSTFLLKLRDDEIATNAPLKARLEEDFGIKLPEIEEYREWKFNTYIEKVEACISTQNKWSILANEALLGVFSFSKFLLQKDLKVPLWKSGPIEENKLIKTLFSWNDSSNTDTFDSLIPDDAKIDDHFEPKDLVYVVDSDSSQTLAIQTALEGRNLVIQGPPGTGKSQTITNIIAGFVAKQKTVLFLAEKIDALNVVKERLKKQSLEPIYLELHSTSATKSEFRSQLNSSLAGLNQTHRMPSPDAHSSLIKNIRELNSHFKRIHKKFDSLGYTPFEIMGKLCRYNMQGGHNGYDDIPGLENHTKSSIDTLSEELEQLSERILASGVSPFEHPWADSTLDELSDTLHDSDVSINSYKFNQIAQKINDLIYNISTLKNQLQITDAFIANLIFSDIDNLKKISDSAREAPDISHIILNSKFLFKNREGLRKTYEAYSRYCTEITIVEEHFNDMRTNFTAYDLILLRNELTEFDGNYFRLFSKRYRTANQKLNSILKRPKILTYKQKLGLLDIAIKSNDLLTNASLNQYSEEQELIYVISKKTRLEKKDFLRKITEWFNGPMEDQEGNLEFMERFVELPQTSSMIDAIHSDKNNLVIQISNAYKLIGIDLTDLDNKSLESVAQRFIRWSDAFPKLNEWRLLNGCLMKIRPKVGDSYYNAIYKGLIPPASLADDIRSKILSSLLRKMEIQIPELSKVDRLHLDRNLREFRINDRSRMKIAEKEVLYNHSIFSSTVRNESKLHDLKTEINKKTRRKPTRKLIKDYGEIIIKCKPVFLMSPLSVAQFLPPDSIQFDVLIIDEASQVKPEDALGAIARAKQMIVVGDEKQLPPTNFFSSTTNDNDDNSTDESEDTSLNTGDLESILDLASSKIRNSVMLSWHYRSQHPSLITVSNKNFYGDKLLLPPSTLRLNYLEDTGLSFVNTPAFAYQRGGADGGTNVKEAEMIAKEAIKFAREHPEESLGVVAFSTKQRDVIREFIEKEIKNNPDTLNFFSDQRKFFVKNLESVQGDERDVIFISVGYGKDSEGKLIQNFGPLGRKGGERRLNVLITRAKKRCTVFSSITADDIKSSDQPGINIFKQFLRFAKEGHMDSPEATNHGYDSPFEEAVGLFLKQSGWKVTPQVGMSGFRIDIGVVDPANDSKYLCGIECDGATYHSSRSARDRDRLREEILVNRGWNIYRIWSTDWFKNRQSEEARLRKYLGQLTTPTLPTSSATDTGHSEYNEENSLDKGSHVYREYKGKRSDQTKPENLSNDVLDKIIKRIIDLEGPIHIDLLSKRTSFCCLQSTTTQRTKEVIMSRLSLLSEFKNNDSFWDNSQQKAFPFRDRSKVFDDEIKKPRYIPPQEMLNALQHILNSHSDITEDALIQMSAEAIGIPECDTYLAAALKLIIKDRNLVTKKTNRNIIS